MKTFRLTRKSTYVDLGIAIFIIAGELRTLFKFLSTSSCPSKTFWHVAFMISGGFIILGSMRFFEEKTAKRIFLFVGIWCFNVAIRYLLFMTSKVWWLTLLSNGMGIVFGIAVFVSCITHLNYLKTESYLKPP